LERIREAAKKDGKARFTALLHHVTPELLAESYSELNPKATPGVDQMTWDEYGCGLAERVEDLHGRVHRGAYRAQPSRRVWIPKADGRQRPIGIAALEDKIVQYAVGKVLEQIYEADFLGFSYGFRPGRSQHDALDALYIGITERKVNWVLDADIRGFFDAIDHAWLVKFLEHRIADRRIIHLIQKWLTAGVSEDGTWSETTVGTPQGSVISPLLANVFLHYALDLWVQQWRTRRARGEVIIVRYADDFVLGFQHRDDAQCCLRELRERLRKFGLELHPEKTRLIEFGRFAAMNRQRRKQGRPETFDFLGFTHYCGTTRGGAFALKRKSIAKRMAAKLQKVKKELREQMHATIREQGRWLGSVVRGWFQYHAVPSNRSRLDRFRKEVLRLWLRTLRRRSQKARQKRTWDRVARKGRLWLPPPRILHPYPSERFYVTHPR
jgi:group II intron reverse transcriptase/maturase